MKKKILILLLVGLISTFNVYGFSESDSKESNMIENILLIGLDGTNDKNPKRSDTMIILTIDKLNKSLKLTSLARDTLVKIPGRGEEKLTHAYAYGKEELLIQTINENFDLDIKEYAVVNFKSFIDIVDIIGGVDIDVGEKEIDHLNEVIKSCYGISNDDITNIEYIANSGKHNLNGYQALAFSRIRYTDSAFARDNRHREVAQSVYKEFAQKGVDTYKRCADIVLNNTKTNISPIEMMNLAYTVLKINDKDIEQFQFPLEEYRKGHIISKQKGWVLEWDKEPNLEAWHKFIFGKE